MFSSKNMMTADRHQAVQGKSLAFLPLCAASGLFQIIR
jgi:hypothetical protein